MQPPPRNLPKQRSQVGAPHDTGRVMSVMALVLSGLFAGGAARAADLIQTYRDAAVNDAQFASARNALLAGREQLPQGLSLLLPQINASASGSRASTEISQPQPFGGYSATYNQRAYTISLSQPLFRWGNYQQYQQGKLNVILSEAQFAQAQQDLIVRVVQAYTDVLYAEDSINYIVAQKAAVSEQLESAKRNFEVGTTTITDTNEAQAKYDLSIAQEILARSNLDIALSALQQIIGKTPGTLSPLVRDVDLSQPEPFTLDPWVASAEQQNYVVAQNIANLEIAQRQIEVNRAGHYPTVDLVASRTYNYTPPAISNFTSQTNNAIGVQISVPLYSGGYTSSKVREGIALADKAGNDLDFARRSAAQSARQSFYGVTSGLAQVRALRAAEVSSQSALDSNKLGYQVGVRTNIDVLNAQQQLYSTQRDLARARYDTLLNGLRLKSAAGTLTEDDLARINALLQH
ncbi:MAG: TolC family outer membrane protein [Burkholderiaceae bacterium]